MPTLALSSLAISPVRLDYAPLWLVLLFAGLATLTVWMGVRSMAGLGPVRRRVAIGVRLLVLLVLFLIAAGMRWQRQHTSLEVLVLRDISPSVANFHKYPAESLDRSIDKYLDAASERKYKRNGDDRIGVISFADSAFIESIPGTSLQLNARPIRNPSSVGTDVPAAIQMALATFRNDAMRRIVLISDGNSNLGDLDAAIRAAASQHVPIDVMPLRYRVDNEVVMDDVSAPNIKRENEPFQLRIRLRSTHKTEVTGRLTVTMDGRPVELEPGKTVRQITLRPAPLPTVEIVQIPGLADAGVHHFDAVFEAPEGPLGAQVDTIPSNNHAQAFTFVHGKGQILYVDNARDAAGGTPGGPGRLLERALEPEGIKLVRAGVNEFPRSLVDLQNYDAVVLANVPRGAGGLDDEQEKALIAYVHDSGGGLVMIGGEDSFGAGGWRGAPLEQILPVALDIPAQRQVPKGALVLVMHSCEMPNGNYWGEQCAIQACKTLSARDEVGVISYGWNNAGGGGIGGAQWDYPLQERGESRNVINAIKNMALGDMPSFDDAVNLAINGVAGGPGLIKSNARQKHIIIVSDGDPAPANATLIQACVANKISISTVAVYPHNVGPAGVPPALEQMAKQTKGRYYGPIESNPNQLPQIFIKEATIVQRSLINENDKGIPVAVADQTSDLITGIEQFPPIFGQVLTSKKPNAANEVKTPLVAMNGKNADPLLAHWQAGLGRTVVFTSDAQNRWAARWVASPVFGKFWSQVIRSVARPPISTDFVVDTFHQGNKGKIVVTANANNAFLNFLNIAGKVVGPRGEGVTVRLVQTAPGTYEGEFDAPEEGNYVAILNYQNKDAHGLVLGGMTVNSTPEMRDLASNDMILQQVAERTGGRLLDPFDAETADLFTRQNILATASPLPVWDILIPILLGLILVDVAVRRIAWDWAATKRMAAAVADRVRSFTTLRRPEAAPTLDALRRVRDEVAEQRFKQDAATAPPPLPTGGKPDPKAKFVPPTTVSVEGDISKVVGGATDKPIPPPPKKIEPKGAPGSGGHTSSLLEAKRRAQQQIRQKEQGEQ